MSVTPHYLFLAMIYIAFYGILWILPTWLLLSIFTPKTLLDRYFKEPHFTLTETYMLGEFPGSLMRTSIWGWALVMPFLDRKRNIKNVRAFMPLWYAMALRALTIGTTMTGVIFLGLMGFLFIIEDYESDHVFFTIPWPF